MGATGYRSDKGSEIEAIGGIGDTKVGVGGKERKRSSIKCQVEGMSGGVSMTADLLALLLMPLRTLQVWTIESIRVTIVGVDGCNLMSSAKRRRGGRTGCGSMRARFSARSSM